jgi:hypothetical protein
MTKDQRLKAMAQVINARHQIKDKKLLGEEVKKIVDKLSLDEKAHRESAAAEHAANLVMKLQQPSDDA